MALVEGPAIARGYPWRIRLTLTLPAGETGDVFPVGVALRAQVRSARNAPSALGELTTSNGGLTRVSGLSLDLVMPASITAQLAAGGMAHLDIVRTDVDPDEYVGVYLRVPVLQPVTVAA